MRSGLRPGPNELAEDGLRPGRWGTANSGLPSPADQTVFGEVVEERGHVRAAVAGGVLDLLANLTERAALPGHRSGGEVPLRVAGHMRRIVIGRAVAGAAWERRCAVTVGAAHDQRLVRPHSIGLGGTLAGRMAVHAARMLQDFARLLEQSQRTCTLIRNGGEARRRAQFTVRRGQR